MIRSALAVCALSYTVAFAGPINPPAGPVAPTMKTLDQVEPRVCVNDLPGNATAVHIITEPGSYYLTGDIIGEPGKHCLVIDTPGSTAYPYIEWNVDLNGFSIIGGTGSLNGIHCVAAPGEPIKGININIGQEVGGGVNDTGGDGIHFENVLEVSVTGLSITGTGGDGIEIDNSAMAGTPLTSGRKSLCQWITASNIGGSGIRVLGTDVVDMQHCAVIDTGGDGIVCDEGLTLNFRKIKVEYAGIAGVRVTNVSSLGVEEEGVKITNPVGDGLVIEDCDAVSLANVHIVDAGGDACRAQRILSFEIPDSFTATGPAGDGLVILDCDEARVRGTSVVNAGGTAYRWWTNKKMSQSSCAAVNPLGHGLDVQDCETLELNGLTIVDGGMDACRVVRVSSLGVEEEGIKITNPVGDGLVVEDGGSASISNVHVNGGGTGIRIYRSVGGGYLEHELKKVRVVNCSANGIDVRDTDRITVSGGSVANCAGDGASIANVIEARVRGLHCSDNDGNGLSGADITNAVIDDLVCAGNGNNAGKGGAIFVRQGTLTIVNGALNDNAGDGLAVEICDTVSVARTVCGSNGGAGVSCLSVGDAALDDIVCAGNGDDLGKGGAIFINMGSVAISDSDLNDNASDGIGIVDAQAVTVARTNMVSNGGYGASVHTCNGTHFKEVEIHLCGTPGGGGTPGFGGGILCHDVASVTLTDSVLDGNQNDGLLVTAGAGVVPDVACRKCTVKSHGNSALSITVGTGAIRDCEFSGNANFAVDVGAAFTGNIDGNHCVNNGGAILVGGLGCSVIRNTGTPGPLGFISAVTPGNVVGPIVDETDVGTSCSPFANVRY